MNEFINISGYQFKKLEKLTELQETLKDFCSALQLKGTILLSEEGINIFLCAKREQMDQFYCFIAELGFSGIDFKESLSTDIPFKYLRIKIKKEIITMGLPEVKPHEQPAPYLTAAELKQWYDEGREFVMLDTRNDYEVRIGKFKNAIDLNIQRFTQFPEACQSQLGHLKDKVIVTNCTGGIRCEKAAPYLRSQGFNSVYQLEGGIIKYLEQFHDSHYEGECFIFDKRMAVDAQLEQTNTVQCHVCRNPVTEPEQLSGQYQENTHCPSCYA